MARIVQIGKRQWLAGMTWNSFEDTPSTVELKEDAQRFGASWVCVRENESAIQAGFCAPIENIERPVKLYSLAAMLADSREQPWLGIFKIEDNLWWYIAVRDGHAILPDGDVIGGEAEIHAARDRHAGYNDWKYIEGDITLLDEFIQSVDAKPTPVRSLTASRLPVMPLVVSIVVLLAVISGGYYWWNQKQQTMEKERVAAIAKMREQMLAGQAVATVASPLLSIPQANDWLSACGAVISPLPLSQQGWSLDHVMCSTESATIRWIRQDGATVANKPDGNLSPEGDVIDQTIPLVGLNKNGVDDAIDLPSAKILLRAWAQAANFTLAINEVVIAPVLPGAPVVPVQTSQVTFKLTIPVSPFDLDLSVIPGLRPTGLSASGTGWIIDGVLYAR